ncbi:hypothetical protein WJX84_009108, partial [Apatococcus fuscideae]
KATAFLWLHAAPSMRFLQVGLVLHDRGVKQAGVLPESLWLLCIQSSGVLGYTPDCSRIMQRVGPEMLRVDLRSEVKFLSAGYNATLIIDYTARIGSWPDDSSGLYRSQPFTVDAQDLAPSGSPRGLRDGDADLDTDDIQDEEDEAREDENEGDEGDSGEGSQPGSDVVQAASQQSVLLATQFEAVSFRMMVPALGDEPIYKPRFTLSLEVPSGLTALSNMPAESRGPSPRRHGYDAVKFEQTPPMPTYIFAMVVGHLGANSNITGLVDQTGAALQAGSRGHELYRTYSNASLPLPKLDLVAVPGKAGAMENWGLLLFDQPRMLTHPVSGGVWDRWRTADVVCHELAHQWFGDLVTCSDWGELTVNEGLASFVEYKCVEAAFPEMPAWALRALTATPTGEAPGVHEGPLAMALDQDAGPFAPALVLPRDGVSSVISRDTSNVYYKGASVMAALEALAAHASPDLIQDGLRRFMDTYRLGNAHMDDALAAVRQAAEASSSPVPSLLTQLPGSWHAWIHAPGYPLLSLGAPADDGSLTVRQQRFFAWGQASLFRLQNEELSAEAALETSTAGMPWPLLLTPHSLLPASSVAGLGATSSASASSGSASASSSASSSSVGASSNAAESLPMREFFAGSTALQRVDVPQGSLGWVLDADGTALQRVNYSEGQWSDLAESLARLEVPGAANESAISPQIKASLLRASHLVSDAFALCFAGHLGPDMLLRIARAVAASPASQTAYGRFVLLVPLMDGLQQLQILLTAASDAICRTAAWEKLPASLIGEQASRLARQLQPNGSLPDGLYGPDDQSAFLSRLTQSKLLAFAALGGQADVAGPLCQAAGGFFATGSVLDPDTASAALMTAINNPAGCDTDGTSGGIDVWQMARNAWENATDIHETDRLLYSMASLRSAAHLQDMLDIAFGLQQLGAVQYVAHKDRLLRAIANAGHGQAILETILSQWDRLTPVWGTNGLLALLATLPLPPHDEAIAAVRDFLTTGTGAGICSTQLRHAILGRLYHHQDWLRAFQPTLCTALTDL